MPLLPSPLARRAVLLAAALALSGCAGTYMAKPAENKNHPGRVTAAQVMWVQPANFQYAISKSAAGYGYTPPKPVISERDKLQARSRIDAVLAAYRAQSETLLRQALAQEGVGPGDETKIYLRPVSASIDANNGAVHVAVQVAVRHADAPQAWTITPVTQNMIDGAYWNVLRKPGIGDTPDVDLNKLVQSFSGTVVREMRLSGWFR